MYKVYFTNLEDEKFVQIAVFASQEQAISFASSLHLSPLGLKHQVSVDFVDEEKKHITQVCVLVNI